MFAYEKGLIWGNDNYRTKGALVNIALATGNVGRPGGGVVRLGGHQEGYVRPSDGHIGRPAPYVDQLLINGEGAVHHIWGCDNYKTTLNAMEFKRVYKERSDKVKDAMNSVPYGDREALVGAIVAAIDDGGLFIVEVDIVPTSIGEAAHATWSASCARWATTPTPTSSKASTGRPRRTSSRTATASTRRAASTSPTTACAMGTNGFQEPATGLRA
jgi:arsenite oxidase large subunit